jgi:hypothetical protein
LTVSLGLVESGTSLFLANSLRTSPPLRTRKSVTYRGWPPKQGGRFCFRPCDTREPSRTAGNSPGQNKKAVGGFYPHQRAKFLDFAELRRFLNFLVRFLRPDTQKTRIRNWGTCGLETLFGVRANRACHHKWEQRLGLSVLFADEANESFSKGDLAPLQVQQRSLAIADVIPDNEHALQRHRELFK